MEKFRRFISNTGSWLKEFFVNIGNLLGAILLVILALFIFALCFFPAIFWKVIISFKKESRKARNILSGTSRFFVGLAIAIDQLGNVAFGGFLNWLFLTNIKEYPFGNYRETISEVLGWNEALGNLNRKGLMMVSILNVIESAHCERAMETGIFEAKYKVSFYRGLLDKMETIKNTKVFLEKYQ